MAKEPKKYVVLAGSIGQKYRRGDVSDLADLPDGRVSHFLAKGSVREASEAEAGRPRVTLADMRKPTLEESMEHSLRRVQELEKENSSLRRQVSDLQALERVARPVDTDEVKKLHELIKEKDRVITDLQKKASK